MKKKRKIEENRRREELEQQELEGSILEGGWKGGWTFSDTEEGEILKISGDRIKSNNEEYQKIKRRIIDNIKNNREKWTIWGGVIVESLGGERHALLVHKEAEFFWKTTKRVKGELILSKKNHGRIHWKSGFTRKQWTEIEQALDKKEFKREVQPNQQTFPRKTVIAFVIIVYVILVPLSVSLYIRKNLGKKEGASKRKK